MDNKITYQVYLSDAKCVLEQLINDRRHSRFMKFIALFALIRVFVNLRILWIVKYRKPISCQWLDATKRLLCNTTAKPSAPYILKKVNKFNCTRSFIFVIIFPYLLGLLPVGRGIPLDTCVIPLHHCIWHSLVMWNNIHGLLVLRWDYLPYFSSLR